MKFLQILIFGLLPSLAVPAQRANVAVNAGSDGGAYRGRSLLVDNR